MLSIPFTNDHIFSIWIIIRTHQESLKNISVQCRQYSAILFLNRSRDRSVCTTLEDGVLQHTPAQVFQRTWFLFCLFGVEGVKRAAKSSLPKISILSVRSFRNKETAKSSPSQIMTDVRTISQPKLIQLEPVTHSRFWPRQSYDSCRFIKSWCIGMSGSSTVETSARVLVVSRGTKVAYRA